ncbi:MAG: hypothetical protein AB7U85_10680 [Alphaproteobacteria bacterium]
MNNIAAIRQYPLIIVAGVISALLFAAIMLGGLFGFVSIYLSAAPLAASGLVFGLPAVIAASLSGILCLILAGYTEAAYSFGMVDCLPVLAAVGLFLLKLKTDENQEKKLFLNYGFVLAAVSLIMSLIIVIRLKSLVSSPLELVEDGTVNRALSLRDIIYTFVYQIVNSAAPDLPIEKDIIVNKITSWAPAIVGVLWFFHIIAGLSFSVWILDRLKKTLRKKPNYREMLLPYFFTAVTLLSAGWGMFASGDNAYLAENIAVFLLTLFILQGLTVVHLYIDKMKYKRTASVVFYIAFAFGSFGVMLGIGVLGLIENFIKLHQIKMVKNSEE